MNLDSIRLVKERHGAMLLALPGVTAVGIGYLEGAASGSDAVGLLVYLEGAARDSDIPKEIDGIPVELRRGRFASPFASLVAEAEPASPPARQERGPQLGNPRDEEFNPMIGGISVNPDFFYFNSWQGTLGLAVSDAAGQPVILSNRHVICGKSPKQGDGVSQPSYEFLSHLAASLVAWQLGDVSYNGRNYGMDAAIASPTNGRMATVGAVYGLPNVVFSANPTLGMNVTKSGLTTNITVGSITGIDVDCMNNNGVVLSNQVIIKSSTFPNTFSESGDSGSAIIDRATNNAVALLWGGNSTTKETMASPIVPVLSHFGCTIP